MSGANDAPRQLIVLGTVACMVGVTVKRVVGANDSACAG